MKFAFRRVGFDFIDTARKTWVVTCDVAAPRDEVWGAISDPTTWKAWFPGVDRAWYRGDPPHGVGTIREAIVSGQHFVEEMVTWDEGKRWAYYVARATLPVARAQLECTEFEDCGAGTRVRWILAVDRRLLLWLAAPFFHRYLKGLFRKAMANLDAHIRAGRFQAEASSPPRA